MEPKALVRSSLKLLIECCALYLLSILALLFGVYSAMQTPLFGGAGLAADMPLWSVMHVYDLALIGVIGFLFARPERREDGYYVAMAAVALSMDPTLFIHRFYGAELAYGMRLGGLGLGLAVAKVLVLAWVCKVPLHGRVLKLLAVAYAFIYVGPALFHLPGQPVRGSWISPIAYGLLSWTPVLMAWLGPRAEDMEVDPADPVEVASVRAVEFRWVALVLPFAGVALHFWQMSGLYDLALGMVHLGPAALAGCILLHRMEPEDAEAAVGSFSVAATFGLLVCATSTGQWVVGEGVFPVTPLRVMLLAQAGIAGYFALRFRLKYFEIHALVTGALFLAGSTAPEICAQMAGPYGWALFTGAAALAYRRTPEYIPAACTWVGAAGTLASFVTGSPASALLLHLAGIGVVALTHAFEGEARERAPMCTLVILALLGHSAAACLDGLASPFEAGRLFLEGGLVLAGAVLTPYWRYRGPVAAGASVAVLEGLPLEWLIENEAVLGLAASFGLLGAGFWVSMNKGDLLERLDDAEPTRATVGVASSAEA